MGSGGSCWAMAKGGDRRLDFGLPGFLLPERRAPSVETLDRGFLSGRIWLSCGPGKEGSLPSGRGRGSGLVLGRVKQSF